MRIIAVFLVLASLACSREVTGPRPFGDALPIDVTSSPASDTSQWAGFSFQDNLIYLSGRMATPDPCYELSAYRSIQGNELRVTIVATRRAKSCPSSIARFDYQSVTDIPACPHLTVWYHFEGRGWPDRKVMDQAWLCASTTASRDRQAAGRLM